MIDSDNNGFTNFPCEMTDSFWRFGIGSRSDEMSRFQMWYFPFSYSCLCIVQRRMNINVSMRFLIGRHTF